MSDSRSKIVDTVRPTTGTTSATVAFYGSSINLYASIKVQSTGIEHCIVSEASVGRSRSNDIVLQNPHVSRNHARIYRRNGEYFLHVDAFTSVTYLNGEVIPEHSPDRKLNDGDVLMLASEKLLFYLDLPENALLVNTPVLIVE